MAIPDYQTLMLPLLRHLGDRREHALRDLVAVLADEFRLTPAERTQPLPSGTQPLIYNRVAWAKTYLEKAGVVEAVRRGVVRLSPRGEEVLRQAPARVDVRFLERFPEFRAFRNASRESGREDQGAGTTGETAGTPEEVLEAAYQQLSSALAGDVLTHVRRASPAFFERLVVQVLVAMGYGGSLTDAGQALGRSGDGGIDGIIKEDRLGLDVIYLQAKRWDGPVGRPEVQKFAGALQGHRARKGVLITTSTFTRDARDFAAAIETKIVLIDGENLAQLMIDHDVGVARGRSFAVKKIDLDFFAEE